MVGEGWRLMKLQFEAMRNGVVRVASGGKVAVSGTGWASTMWP